MLDEVLPPNERARLDPYSSALVACLSDDPYASLRSMRSGFGDGWLISHLWDLLARAGAVGADVMSENGLEIRAYLLLQHARALGSCASLWQLSAHYAADLLVPGGAATLGDAAAAQADDAARAWLRELVQSQQPPMHAVRLRKLLTLCEQYGMMDEAHALVSRAAGAKRAAKGVGELAEAAAAQAESMAMNTSSSSYAAAPAASSAAPLVDEAKGALNEAIDAALVQDNGGRAPEDGPATAALRALLRCEGIGGGSYYAGPRWLPPFFSLLGLIASPKAAGPHASQQAKTLLIGLASGRVDSVGDGLPDALMLELLRFVGGLTKHATSHAEMLCAKADQPIGGSYWTGDAPPAPMFSVEEVQLLLSQYEKLRASGIVQYENPHLLNAPGEAANSRASSLLASEQQLSRALSQALAAAILYTAAKPSRETGWGTAVA